MTANRRQFAGAAVITTLVSGVNSSQTTAFTLASDTGWPASNGLNFLCIIDEGLATEEKIECSGRTGTSLAVVSRGADGTTGASHNAGAEIKHVAGARDFDEYSQHTSDTEADPHSTKLLNNARHDLTARHGSAVVDHGSIGGLSDDDHSIYLNVARHDVTARHPAAVLATNSVETAKIVDLNVTTGKINDLAVTTGKLAASAVTTAKVADDGITLVKLNNTDFTVQYGADATHTLVAGTGTYEAAVTKSVPAGDYVIIGKGYLEYSVGATEPIWTIRLRNQTGSATLDDLEHTTTLDTTSGQNDGREAFMLIYVGTLGATSTIAIEVTRSNNAGTQIVNTTKLVAIPIAAFG